MGDEDYARVLQQDEVRNATSFSSDNNDAAFGASANMSSSSKPARVSLDCDDSDSKMPANQNASSSDNSKMSGTKPRDLKDLLFSPKLINEIERVKTDQKDDSEFEKIVREFIPVLQSCNCDKLAKSEQRRFHKALYEALKKYGCEDLINVGDDRSDETLLLM